MKDSSGEMILYAAWAVAFAATLGSLYFSEIRGFAPCILCWYQRIAIYPLVFIIGAGILKGDKKVYHYVLPLSVIGLGISVFHNLLYWRIIPEALAPCVAGVSCTTRFIQYFGFVTIPFLSFSAFALITILMIIYRKMYANQ